MSQVWNIAVVGATGQVGKAVVSLLEEQEDLSIGRLYALASDRSEEETLLFRSKPVLVGDLAGFDFSQVQIAVFAVPVEVAGREIPRALAAGCRVIDHSPVFRLDRDAALTVAELNLDALRQDQQLFTCADATSASLAPLLAAINSRAGLSRVHLTVLRAVSAQGEAGIRELARQTGELLNARGIDNTVYPQQVAFNLLPLVGSLGADAQTDDERAISEELQELLGRPDLAVEVSCVTAPVFYGHGMALFWETEQDLGVAETLQILGSVPNLELETDSNEQGVATPVTDAAGKDAVYLSRLRVASSTPRGFHAWVVADNVRQGAASHSVQIVKKVIKDFKY